jgi:transglycosylase-like protein with SLT domain
MKFIGRAQDRCLKCLITCGVVTAAGARYLRELLERYNFDLVKALAAYNAGPELVEQYGGVPPYYETRAYVASIVKDFNRKKFAQQKAAIANTETNSNQHRSMRNPNSAASPQHNPCIYIAVLRNGFQIRHQRRR